MSADIVALRPGFPGVVGIDRGEPYGEPGWIVFIGRSDGPPSVWCGSFDRYAEAVDVAIERSRALGGVRIVDFQTQPLGAQPPVPEGAA